MKNFTSETTSTLDSNLGAMLFSAVRDTDGYWLFSDRETDVWGRGRSLLEAMCDYWAALFSHLGVLEDERLAPRLQRQVKEIRRRLELYGERVAS